MKTFDSLGLSTSFTEAYDTLDIKGVQLESLGFVSLRHALGWGYFNHFNQVHIKLLKYLRNNAYDLAAMKNQALEDFNYDQLENFIEYEDFLGKSYFTIFVNEFMERAKSQTTIL